MKNLWIIFMVVYFPAVLFGGESRIFSCSGTKGASFTATTQNVTREGVLKARADVFIEGHNGSGKTIRGNVNLTRAPLETQMGSHLRHAVSSTEPSLAWIQGKDVYLPKNPRDSVILKDHTGRELERYNCSL